MKKSKLDIIKEIAEGHGGTVLNKKYVAYGRMRFKCKDGHVFYKTPIDIRKGKWCRKCSFSVLRTPFNEIKLYAKSKGGKCLSAQEDFRNLEASILKWECKKGHTFSEKFHNMKRRKNFCLICMAFQDTHKEKSSEKIEKFSKMLATEYYEGVASCKSKTNIEELVEESWEKWKVKARNFLYSNKRLYKD